MTDDASTSTEGLNSEVPMSYLKKGDRIRLVSTARLEVLYATVDMDGHRVSTEYGSRTGNTYYEDPEKNYINVKFDHTSYRSYHPNGSIRERDGWRIFVNTDTARRISGDMRELVMDDKRQALAQRLAEAERVVAEVRAELEKLA